MACSPDVKVDVATALDVAHALALEKISASAEAQPRRQLALILEAVNARLRPHPVPRSLLASFAGDYEGGRRVTAVGDNLFYQNVAGALPEQLVALNDSTFALSSQARLVFDRNENGNWRMRVMLPDGGQIAYARLGTGG